MGNLDEAQWQAIRDRLPEGFLDRVPCAEKKCEHTCHLGCQLRDLLKELKEEVFSGYHNTMKQINSKHTLYLLLELTPAVDCMLAQPGAVTEEPDTCVPFE